MLWPIEQQGALLLRILPDEADGKLSLWVKLGNTCQEIVYEGMFYSQLDETAVGESVVLVVELAPQQLWQQHSSAARRLCEDCGASQVFLQEMLLRGNHLYFHKTVSDKEYLVLAKRLAFGEMRAAQELGEGF